MTDLAHSRLGASGAHRWFQCPGSVRLSEGMPNESSIYAKEGTAAHQLGEKCLNGKWDADRFIDEDIIVGNDVFTVDEEMAEAVQVYLDTVRGIYQDGDELMIEKRFSLKYVNPECFGTCDAVIYRPTTGELFVFDYKHGKGVPVSVEHNPQLLYYALGAAVEEQDRPLGEIEYYVIQPRAPHADGPVRKHRISALELMDWTSELEEAVGRALSPNADLKAGEWCKFCPAAGICPALRNASVEAAQSEFAVVEDLSPEQVGEILEKADMIEDWVRSVRAHAFAMLENGFEVPGYKLVAKRPQRKWHDEEAAARHMIGVGFEQDEIYKLKLKTPAQLEKLLPKDRRDELEAFYAKESSGNTLARNTDKREAVNVDRGAEFATDDDIF